MWSLPETGQRGNFLNHASFFAEMKAQQKPMRTEATDMDRRPIRIDMPPEHSGVMAALRRAFEAAAEEPSDRDFADLLRKLN
jgi:hypothetical protein